MDFEGFVEQCRFLLNGDQKEKISFLFKMISINKETFNQTDLINFYKMINYQRDEQLFILENAEEQGIDEFILEIEMAQLVFIDMSLNDNEYVSLEQFRNYLLKKKEAFKLFDFLEGDIENNRNLIKMQQTYLALN